MIDNLIEQIDELGISQYFDEVLGIDNIFADGKIPIAKKFLKDKNPDDCIIIGDTIHDYEVAKELNINYALVAKGHQAKDVLEKECDNVYDDISEVVI